MEFDPESGDYFHVFGTLGATFEVASLLIVVLRNDGMDPFTITAACTGLIAGIAQLSVQISSFVGDVRDARKDMDAVSRELGSLSLCLHALGDDSENPALPDGLTESLKAILRNCDLVVTQMKALLKKMGSGHLARRIQWSTFGKDEMNKLRSSLESHKSAFTIAVDISSM